MVIFAIFLHIQTNLVSLCSDGLYLLSFAEISFIFLGQTLLSNAPDIVQNSLLGMVIFLSALGIGWVGKRLFSKDGILESTAAAVKLNAEATAQIGNLIDQHDKHQTSHHNLCFESNHGVKRLQNAALVACDQLEEVCKENKIDVGDRIRKVREALNREFKSF
jgi:hypothetical protein